MAFGHHKVRKDGNQTEIVQILRAYGAEVINCTALKNAFDLLVLYKGRTFICEIKQPKGKMSEGELKCKALVEGTGNKYWVIRTPEDAIEMLQSSNLQNS